MLRRFLRRLSLARTPVDRQSGQKDRGDEMTWLQWLFYPALAACVIGTGYKVVKIARMPMHLRWDLYPIPHERGKSHYGGSYYEEVDWWTRPIKRSLVGELWGVAKEIFLIQSMYHHNRHLWVFSLPFHLGLYLMVGFVALLGLGVVWNAGSGLPFITTICGVAGAIPMTLGGIGLLISRITKPELRGSSLRTDYFNLLLLIAIGGTLTGVMLGGAAGFDQVRAFIGGIVTFSAIPEISVLVTVHIVLAAIFMLWLPMTHMTHFVGKYFTYHRVRWEDHPNVRGGEIEGSVVKSLDRRITWSGPHIKSGGTWKEAASESGKESDRQ